jgi:hypothetical protein
MNATTSGELFHSAGSPITEWHYIKYQNVVNIRTHSDVYLEQEMPLALSLPLVNQQKNSPARNPNEIRNINSLKYHRIRLHLYTILKNDFSGFGVEWADKRSTIFRNMSPNKL